jgi:hypothetical protein
MKSTFLAGWSVLVIVLAWANASTRAEDLNFTDMDVRLVSYSTPLPSEDVEVRAAFLSDEQGEPILDPMTATKPALNGPAGEVAQPGDLACNCGAACCDVTMNGCGTSCGVGAMQGCGGGANCCGRCGKPTGVYYAEVQAMWMRAHLMEGAVGKLSEQYELAPRFIGGYEGANGVGARIRWWHYGHQTPVISTGEGIRFQFDVIDLEGTSRFHLLKSTDLVVSGGFRWTTAEITFDGDTDDNGMLGLTFAADLRTLICGGCQRQWAGICGARLSTLGGNWEGDGGFVPESRDDNLVVQELYAGVEYSCRTRGGQDLFARLVWEMQNWHSDAIAQNSGADSIGFVGPGIHVGAGF